MKLKELAVKFTEELATIYDAEESRALFFLVIEHYLGVKRVDFVIKKEDSIALDHVSQIDTVLQELTTGRPIQYIIGEALFYGLIFKVNSAVLIPRPETEELVQWMLESVKHLNSAVPGAKPLKILDIGTGSGCIAISLKKNLPTASVSAFDISSDALSIATQNALMNEVEVNFRKVDILHIEDQELDFTYNIILSNPPYITQEEKGQMHQNVLTHEPHLALFVSDKEPLVFYEAIADFALGNLLSGGLLFFEINEHLGKRTLDMLVSKGFEKSELRKDMQGKDRMICCVKL